MTIVEFLLARIAEDEQQARDDQAAAMSGSWPAADRLRGHENAWNADQVFWLNSTRRVLAECEAKLRIVSAYEQADRMRTAAIEGLTPLDRARMGGEFVGLNAVIIWLAAVHADHPDYDTAWRLGVS